MTPPPFDPPHGSNDAIPDGETAAQTLLRFIERIENLEEEKRGIADAIKDVYASAKGRGFDVKVMRQMVRERRLSREERAEFQALCETYRAALGMLDGTPLGDFARLRLEEMLRRTRRLPPPRPRPPQGDEHAGAAPADDAPDAETPEAAPAPTAEPPPPEEPEPAPPTPEEIEAARAQGADNAGAGRRITDNPFPPLDPRRAAWDEGFCTALGTDGMDIPEAFRRKPKDGDEPKKGGGKGAGSSGATGSDEAGDDEA